MFAVPFPTAVTLPEETVATVTLELDQTSGAPATVDPLDALAAAVSVTVSPSDVSGCAAPLIVTTVTVAGAVESPPPPQAENIATITKHRIK
jgi:hypothetical protein